MPTYIALIYTPEIDWKRPEFSERVQEYLDFEKANKEVLRGGHALYPTATAWTIRVPEGKDRPILSDSPYAETKEALTGFFMMECETLDEANSVAAKIPAVAYGTVEVRPVHTSLEPVLTTEALHLAKLLAELMPDEPTALGLHALLLLRDQDSALLDQEQIRHGVTLIGTALRDPSNPYVAQAVIAASHALAPSRGETDLDWDAVISWYDTLLAVYDTPVVRLNRAAAVAERDGPAAGLALVEEIKDLTGYPWWHATRAELLRRLGRVGPARDAYEQALELRMNDPQTQYLRRRHAELPES
jgi:predicted RNA polymerase sigma factor